MYSPQGQEDFLRFKPCTKVFLKGTKFCLWTPLSTSVNLPLTYLYASTDFYLENLQYLLTEIKLALGQVVFTVLFYKPAALLSNTFNI